MGEKIGEFYYEITADGKIALSEISKNDKALEALGLKAKSISGIFSTTLGNIKAGYLAIYEVAMKVWEVVGKFFSESIKNAIDDARANVIFENSLRKIGLAAKDVQKDVDKMAQTNGFDDGDIKSIYNYGIAIGVSKDKLKQFVQTAIDYNAQTGKGLEMSMRTVGNIAKTNSIEFDRLSKSVEGSGEAYANADRGIKKMEVSWKEFTSSFGTATLDVMKPMISIITEALKNLKIAFDAAFPSDIDGRIIKAQGAVDKAQKSYNDEIKRLMEKPIFGSKGLSFDEASAQIKKGGPSGSVYYDKITAEEYLNQLIKERNALQNKNNNLNDKNVGTTKTQDQLQQQLSDSINSIVGNFEKLTGLSSESGKEFNQMGMAAKGLFENIQNINESLSKKIKPTTSDMMSILITIGTVVLDIVGSIGKLIEGESQSDKIQKEINDDLKKQKEQLDAINLSLKQNNAEADRLANKPNQTSADILARIQAEEKVLKDYQDQYNANQEKINKKPTKEFRDATQGLIDDLDKRIKYLKDTANFLNGDNKKAIDDLEAYKIALGKIITAYDDANTAASDNVDINTHILEQQDKINKLKKELLIIDNENLLATEDLQSQLLDEQMKYADDATKTNLIQQTKDNINAQIDALTQILNVTDDQNDRLKLQIEIQQNKNKLTQIELDAQKAITDQLAKQNDMTAAFQSGALDVQNFSDIQYAVQRLQNQGYYGSELYSQLTSLGIDNLGIAGAGGDRIVNLMGGITVNNAVSFPSSLDNAVSQINKKLGGVRA